MAVLVPAGLLAALHVWLEDAHAACLMRHFGNVDAGIRGEEPPSEKIDAFTQDMLRMLSSAQLELKQGRLVGVGTRYEALDAGSAAPGALGAVNSAGFEGSTPDLPVKGPSPVTAPWLYPPPARMLYLQPPPRPPPGLFELFEPASAREAASAPDSSNALGDERHSCHSVALRPPPSHHHRHATGTVATATATGTSTATATTTVVTATGIFKRLRLREEED